ncbi:MAG: hypothetical protein NT062_17545 [Proteobacteria bacterium]|nr:hypothetical protein [Pseudomonadota bacterium]
MDADDARVIDAADAADLVHEQPAVLRRRIDVGVDDLDRDVALDGELVRAVHGAERAARDLRVDPEPSRQHAVDELVAGQRRGAGRPGAHELAAPEIPQPRHAIERRRVRERDRRGRREQRGLGDRPREVGGQRLRGHRAGARIDRLAAQPAEQRVGEGRSGCGRRVHGDQIVLRAERREPRLEARGVGARRDDRAHVRRAGLRQPLADPRERQRRVVGIRAMHTARDERGARRQLDYGAEHHEHADLGVVGDELVDAAFE